MIAATAGMVSSQPTSAQKESPTNDPPDPYRTVADWFRSDYRKMVGSTSAVDIDRDGTSIWVAGRCGSNSCFNRAIGQITSVPTVFKFSQNGTLVRSFGAGLMVARQWNFRRQARGEPRNHNGWKRGIRVGSLTDGKVIAFIPDPAARPTGTSAAQGVAADAAANIYGAEVGPMDVKKYSKKQV
jgi:hypothetical protein